MAEIQHWSRIGQHALLPQVGHDDLARLNVVAQLNAFLSGRIAPTVAKAYEKRGRPAFEARHGRAPVDRHDVAEVMVDDPTYQMWSGLRRNTMEMRQQIGRGIVLRQAFELAQRADALNADAPTLELHAHLELPEYLASGDQHLMPGGYAGEVIPGDVSAAANYDVGLFATLAGHTGPQNDLAGRTLVSWLRRTHPDFRPRRILDLGCGLGHNTLPVRAAFPDAEVIAMDAAAPMLRYGHARAHSLGFDDVRFVQGDIRVPGFEDDSFDLVFTTMVLHETCAQTIEALFAQSHRLLAPGGLTVHLEQPPYRQSEPFEQFMRDWDGRNNNEPFWSRLHDASLPDELVAAGFRRDAVFEDSAIADGWEQGADPEDFGRAPRWYVAGAWHEAPSPRPVGVR